MASKNGCHNREPFKQTMKVQDGYIEGGPYRVAETVETPFRMANECQYTLSDLGKTDKGCEGCKHKRT